jgi:hypothetical protein
MVHVQRPQWLEELIGIVGRLCPEPESRGDRARGEAPEDPAPNARRVGRVTADEGLGPGCFWVGLDGRPLEDDQIEAAFLAPGGGSMEHKFLVIETVQEGRVLKVRVAEHAPRQGLFLWVPQQPRGLLDISLLDGLSSISEFELVNRIAVGRADPIPENSSTSKEGPSLNDGQRRAWRACRARGVHLVWGPPGTGKTMVIAAALQDLMAAGKSVLLVSGTNIAVDNALARAAKTIKLVPGQMVRAGNPHLTEIADNHDICLQKIVHDRQQGLEQQRAVLEEQIQTTRSTTDPLREELAAARDALADYDPAAYLAATTRRRDEELLAQRRGELAALLREGEDLARAGLDADERLQSLTLEEVETEDARGHLSRAARCREDLNELEHAAAMAESTVTKFEDERDRLTADLAAARKGRRFGHRDLKRDIRENEELRARATERRNHAAELFQRQAPSLQEQIVAHEAAAFPRTAQHIATLDRRLADARNQVARITVDRKTHANRVRDITTQVEGLQAKPRLSPADREFLARAAACDLPRKHAELPALERRVASTERDIARLEKRHEDILSRMHKEGTQVRRDIIAKASVVAATLALLRMRPELRDRQYDHVIVDEVSFAAPPEVIYAASRAREGVTLLGDFLQNGPIAPEPFRESPDPAVQRWYARDSFAAFGILDAESALRNPGCAVLTEQYRFGPVITELANLVAYGGVLRAAASSPVERGGQGSGVGQAEVVLLDVDGLGDELAGVRPGQKSGQWWPIGALLARSLAGQRVRQAEAAGESAANMAGIVTPYAVQQDLVRDILNESGGSPHIEVGTSHRFQGREFDTVIFDLVEDGTGWVANGDLAGTSWAANGLRMFNVGITRAQRRLYLVANSAAVSKAKKGPLLAIKQLVEAGKVHVVRAATVLGLPEAPNDDPVASELWHALRGHATLLSVHDEETLPAELAQRIDAAAISVWLWSPWVGKRSEELLPHLIEAQGRGVRVYPVVLPRDEVTRYLKPRHEQLAAQVPPTIYLRKEHQKIVLIDDSLAFLGSMNVLAHRPGGRLEVMALFQSRALVSELMAHERTDELASPPTCPQCGSRVTLVRASGAKGRLHWHCEADYMGGKCGWRRPFTDRHGGRNQSRR